MPRRARSIEGGYAYHVLNRANAQATLFRKDADYEAFERILEEACEREPLRILAYCVMPNHWHLVVWPRVGEDRLVSEFMRWLTVTHVQRCHAHRRTSGTGSLYQGRFKAFPIQADEHLYAVLRYVERNPLRANLVARAEMWKWSSLWRTCRGNDSICKLLSPWPVPRPQDWVVRVNRAQSEAELTALRRSVRRGQPFGSERWTQLLVSRLGLDHTIRDRGRPRKAAEEK